MARHERELEEGSGRCLRPREGGGSGSTPEFMRDHVGAGRSATGGGEAVSGVPATGRGRSRRDARPRPGGPLRLLGIVLGIIAILGMLLLIAYVVISNTSAFTIASIDAEDTEHISAADIARLADVAEGTTLLNVNEEEVRESLHRNPWVGEVEIVREFPDRLRVVVSERRIEELVILGTGGVVWCLGTGQVWVEPLELAPEEGQTVAEAALAAARDMGALLVVDVPVGVNPKAGAEATDEELLAVQAFREQLSGEFLSQVVQMSAPGPESISCMLESGVTVSLGGAAAIPTKEVLVEQLLARYPNRLTYINVRVPSKPTYRMVDSESVQEGTGVFGAQGEAGAQADEGDGTNGDGAGDSSQDG